MKDLIDRQAAIKAIKDLHDCYNGFSDTYDKACIIGVLEELPPAQPKQTFLTNDDIETIRIHLGAFKEKLCNQKRWNEAKEYEGIIERLLSLPSAQPEIIRCKDCKWCKELYDSFDGTPYWMCKNWDAETDTDGFCYEAERRTDE